MDSKDTAHSQTTDLTLRLRAFFAAAGYPHLPRQTIIDMVRRGSPHADDELLYGEIIRAHGFDGTEVTDVKDA